MYIFFAFQVFFKVLQLLRKSYLILVVVDDSNISFDQRQGSIFQNLDQRYNLVGLTFHINLGQDSNCSPQTFVNLLGLQDGHRVLDFICGCRYGKDQCVLPAKSLLDFLHNPTYAISKSSCRQRTTNYYKILPSYKTNKLLILLQHKSFESASFKAVSPSFAKIHG